MVQRSAAAISSGESNSNITHLFRKTDFAVIKHAPLGFVQESLYLSQIDYFLIIHSVSGSLFHTPAIGTALQRCRL
jgi:hypothetical protein